ncbi:MAG TPA: hypothetical protein VF075_12495 [Pyrinomonadaceae bacterium]
MTYQSETEIRNMVRAFEACETGKDAFKHRDHLSVAVWYVETLGREAALDRMRSSLMRFLDHHAVDKTKYSETVTIFWIDKVAEKLNELGPKVSLVEKCNTIAESLDFEKAKAPSARQLAHEHLELEAGRSL